MTDSTEAADHADIMETIENASGDWQKLGYPSALAEVRDMANIGRALMDALPKGYSYMNCPSEIVSDLQNERDEALAIPSQPDADALREAVLGEVELLKNADSRWAIGIRNRLLAALKDTTHG